jgi:hypothetical protein
MVREADLISTAAILLVSKTSFWAKTDEIVIKTSK